MEASILRKLIIGFYREATQALYEQIGKLHTQIEFLKKIILDYTLEERRNMVEKHNKDLCICKQCRILSIHRSGLYYKPYQESEENLAIMFEIDKIHLH